MLKGEPMKELRLAEVAEPTRIRYTARRSQQTNAFGEYSPGGTRFASAARVVTFRCRFPAAGFSEDGHRHRVASVRARGHRPRRRWRT